jgi:hypothetical protein
MFKEAQLYRVLPYDLSRPAHHTIIYPSTICKTCKNTIAEIFQDSGDYSLSGTSFIIWYFHYKPEGILHKVSV